MLSIQECRKILEEEDDEVGLTDEKVREIRDSLYKLADIALDDYFDTLKRLKEEAQKIEEVVKPHILRCRPGDWEHAKRVAGWVAKIGISGPNLPMIMVAAYVHDIGWRDLVGKEKITFDQLLELEPQANKNSEPFIREVIGGLDYSEEDIKTILRLVRAADKHQSKEEDEKVIVDADSLSKLNIDHLKQKYQKSEWMRLYELWNEELPKRIKTERAKKEYPKLLRKLKNEITT